MILFSQNISIFSFRLYKNGLVLVSCCAFLCTGGKVHSYHFVRIWVLAGQISLQIR